MQLIWISHPCHFKHGPPREFVSRFFIMEFARTNIHLEPPSLAPLPAKLADFNFLLRQCPAERFSAPNSDQGVIIFKPTAQLDGASPNQPINISLSHTVFLVCGSHAAQLQINQYDLDTMYFSARAKGPGGKPNIIIERNFEHVMIGDADNRIPQKIFSLSHTGTDHIQRVQFQPLPAYPRTLLWSESLGYVCFAFEHVGAYPKATPQAFGTVGIRGFQGNPTTWREFEVTSTIIAGRGLHNLTFQSELGEFFIPGPASCGPAIYTAPGRGSVDVQDFDPADLVDPSNRLFNIDAHRALRSLGLPAAWPPPEML